MKNQNETSPPQWAQRFMRWYCRPELLEDLQGDLHEYFQRNVKSKGLRRARIIYVLDVLKFLRPYTSRTPKYLNLLIQWIMLGSYLKTSVRSISRNKLFSGINIIGLAISMTVSLILIAVLVDMNQYDRFNAHGDRIYRVISKRVNSNSPYASTSWRAGILVAESVEGVERVAIFQQDFQSDVKAEMTTVPMNGMYANESVFEVFSFPFLAGDPSTALREPFSIVLTETAAKRLFGLQDALGRVVRMADKDYTITGVMKDVPKFSHVRFEMLVSLKTRESLDLDHRRLMSWDYMWDSYTYLLVQENRDLKSIQAKLDVICEKENKGQAATKAPDIQLQLQPLFDIALGEDLNNSIGPVMGSSEVWMIGVLSFVVILSACFNYTNLSIARAMNRSREVGIRKVIGALRGHVVNQFVVEAVVIALMSLMASFILFLLLKPQFLSIGRELQEMLTLDLSLPLVGYFVLLAVILGVTAGFFPALFFSKLNAIGVLKGSNVGGSRKLGGRKALIVIQYAISLVFISATIIGVKQYNHLLTFDLGYNTENVFNIQLQDNKADVLVNELSQMSEVKAVSRSVIVTSLGNYWGAYLKYKDPQDSTWVDYNGIDENYLPLHGHKLVVGRNFGPSSGNREETEVIVNEALLRRMNIGGKDPLKAVDEIVKVYGKELKIIGVLKDYQYGKVDSRTESVILRYQKDKARFVNVKITTTDWPATLARIELAWRKIDTVHPLKGMFYDDQIKQSYSEISAMIKIIGFLSFLAICISSLGLLGMVVFTTETRLKEISIRKVLGAGEWKLIFLLGKGFLVLLVVASLIALPLTFLFFDQVALPELIHPAPIGLPEMLTGASLVMIIALLLIGFQTLKVARTNPAEILKNE